MRAGLASIQRYSTAKSSNAISDAMIRRTVPAQWPACRSAAKDWTSWPVTAPTASCPKRSDRWQVHADWSDCQVRACTSPGRTPHHAEYTSSSGVRPAAAGASRPAATRCLRSVSKCSASFHRTKVRSATITPWFFTFTRYRPCLVFKITPPTPIQVACLAPELAPEAHPPGARDGARRAQVAHSRGLLPLYLYQRRDTGPCHAFGVRRTTWVAVMADRA
jgi:hypothetical protein